MKALSISISFAITIMLFLSGCGYSDTNQTKMKSINLDDYNLTALDDNQKYSLAYMWNEERLAQDLYLNLYNVNSDAIQLYNIALKSEAYHIELVENLVKAYDLNITNLVDYTQNYSEAELKAMPAGTYGVTAIQDLYNTLYNNGAASVQASLEVGCMVEVTDIDDLDKYIIDAKENQALIDTFNLLKDGSYSHYWAFDRALKNLGITDGCCSLGSAYCKPDYPNQK